MGKGEDQNLPQQQSREVAETVNSSRFLCGKCSIVLRRVSKELNFKCVFFFILGFAVFVPGILWVLPIRARNLGFEAKDAIKLSATVQVYFVVEKPVKELLPHIGRLEFDINGELGVPDVKVSVLSMHEIVESNKTYVIFGFLSEYINAQINPVSMSLLRSCLYELFLRESNLTLTTSLFGQPSGLEILKFPGGISLIPFQHASIWQFPQMVFNFTLTHSISEILHSFIKFKKELKSGLRLRSYENVFVQITNKIGSTLQPPVTVQASISSEMGRLTQQRLKQLAAIINSSPKRNLGLDNSTFGEVKIVSLSSYLKGTPNAMPPTLPPAPAPAPGNRAKPSRRLVPPPGNSFPPPANCESSSPPPGHAIPPSSHPKSTRLIVPPVGFSPTFPPDLLPKPKNSFGSKPWRSNERHGVRPVHSSHG